MWSLYQGNSTGIYLSFPLADSAQDIARDITCPSDRGPSVKQAHVILGVDAILVSNRSSYFFAKACRRCADVTLLLGVRFGSATIVANNKHAYACST